jgi:hypothetical protein
MNSESIVYDMSAHLPRGPHEAEIPSGVEVWSYDQMGMQTDLFDSLMDFGDSR